MDAEELASEMHCDNCGRLVRCGMPDGRYFELVHADNGAAYCSWRYDPVTQEYIVPRATYHGQTGIRYRMG